MKLEICINELEGSWWFDIGLSGQTTEYTPTKYVVTIALLFFSIYIRFGKWKHKCKWVRQKSEHNGVIYTTRSCQCGRRQLLADGGFGDNRWHDDKDYQWKFPHNKDGYNQALGS